MEKLLSAVANTILLASKYSMTGMQVHYFTAFAFIIVILTMYNPILTHHTFVLSHKNSTPSVLVGFTLASSPQTSSISGELDSVMAIVPKM